MRREQAIVLGFIPFEDPAETYDIENIEETGTYKANLYRVAVVPCQKTTETYETLYAVENIHYIPVQTKSFQNIKVHLRSSTDEPIPFEHGRAAITLHLRRLNYFD